MALRMDLAYRSNQGYLPLTLPILEIRYSAPVVCTVAAIASIQEGHYIRTGNIN